MHKKKLKFINTIKRISNQLLKKKMKLIENTKDLEVFCQELKKHPFITVDLEFLREKTYYAKLCLIQVGSLTECAIIDPLSPTLNLDAFFDILQNQNIVKVFHSGRQDIEILYFLTGKIPTPLFDTQIAAMVCGYGESVGYESLVRHILHIELDKTSRLSDWSRRPLDNTQLEYALADVTHLLHVYEHLQQQLQENDRSEWIQEEMATLSNPDTYIVRPEEAWMRIRHRSHNARFLTLLRELAAWRERRSQRKNTPRQSFIKDDMLLNIATACPKNKEELCQIRNLKKEIATGKLGDEILEVIEHFSSIPKKEYVIPPKEKALPSADGALFELLRLLLRLKSLQEGVVARLIADDEELRSFSAENDEGLPMLSGWRKEIFGNDALALREGNLTISYDSVKHRIKLGNQKN